MKQPQHMIKKYFILIFACLFILARCATQQKIDYEIPINATPEQKEALRARLDMGQALYKSNCSRCHGIFTKGKNKIPNFTKTQVELYKARFALRDSTNHAFAQKMTPEDLDVTLHFLLLRKMPPGSAPPDSSHHTTVN